MSFLNLWSYPNPYREQKLNGKGDGKELCDLLVVCSPYVLIFSEKDIAWSDKPEHIAWSRWFRNAVVSSADQTKGAERWIDQFPDRIFLDPQCTQPLPLDIPASDERIVHRIVVARGAGEACRKHFGGGTGSLLIRPDIVGDKHWNTHKHPDSVAPFCVGDVDPQGSFVHVLDDGSLDFVISELDTISDFTNYLDKKAKFARTGRLLAAHGEEDLVAYYAVRINEDGDHDFSHPEDRPWRDGEAISIAEQVSSLKANPQYIAKQVADRPSYVWDELISLFATHMLNGTSIVPAGHHEYDIRASELSLRYMTMENRFQRRGHGEAILGALREAEGLDGYFFRSMYSHAESKNNETGFFLLIFPYADWMEDHGGYDHYRLKRSEYASTYGEAMLLRLPYLKRVVGVAIQPPHSRYGSSEDLVRVEQTEWTANKKKSLEAACKAMGIAQNLTERRYVGDEFPDAIIDNSEISKSHKVTSKNRKARRGEKSRHRRGKG